MSDFDKSGVWTFAHAGRDIACVFRAGRGRSLKLVVRGPGDVEVRVPPRCSARAARAFAVGHADWILKTADRLSKRPRAPQNTYGDGDVFYHLGNPLRLEVVRSVWKQVSLRDGVLRVSLYNHTDRGRVRELVEAWFREQAQAELAAAFERAVRRFGERLRWERGSLAQGLADSGVRVRLTVRAMKTRWGSCTKDGHVTLSAELVHAPPRLIEYVIVHELCHLARLDHSPAYYFRLAQCLPDWKERRKALQTRSWQAQV